MTSNPLISVVVTVYNKEKYLPATIRSLTEQEGDLDVEYIFVDDVSSDTSLAVIEQATRHILQVTVVKNSSNEGPSIRINQGVRLARGKYVLCFDSDDILAGNALKVMSDALIKYQADIIYGQWSKTNETGEALLCKRIADDAKITMSDTPLETVLNGRYLRMQFMARRELFLKAGGADERVFIQDESIPLRMATHAKRLLKLHDTVMYVPHIEGALSCNVSQLNHDRFYAHYNLLKDYPTLSDTQKKLTYRGAISCGWKQFRYDRGLGRLFHWILPAYLKSRRQNTFIDPEYLNKIDAYMRHLPGVRRVRS